jgi:glycosyltransferase involved in cell wall biosynthesis
MSATLTSLVIATYRRPDMLRDTLISLEKLIVPDGAAVEIVVIDNDPEGSARAAVEELLARPLRFPTRYVHEQRKGLSWARNRGIEESRGDIIAFLDDDLYVAENWLSAMLACFARTNAAVVGGRTVLHWEGEPEKVIRLCMDEIGDLDMGEQDHEIRGRELPGGGNSAFRRSVFSDGRRFATDLGRVGKVLLSGEDSEMFERIRRDRLPIWYCAGALVHHRTGGERLTEAYMVRQRYWFGVSHAIIDQRLYGKTYQLSCALARLGKALLVDAPDWALGWIRRNPVKRLLARASLLKQLGYVRATVWPRGFVPAGGK